MHFHVLLIEDLVCENFTSSHIHTHIEILFVTQTHIHIQMDAQFSRRGHKPIQIHLMTIMTGVLNEFGNQCQKCPSIEMALFEFGVTF